MLFIKEEEMQGPYVPLAFANQFIIKSHHNGLHHMKLQKLCFYAYGWWLAWDSKPIMTEGPEVWKYGPVFSSLYNALAHFGRERIFCIQKNNPFNDAPKIHKDDKKTQNLVNWIWHRYGNLSGFDLSTMTHEKGTPWHTEVERMNYLVPEHYKIPNEIIKHYFELEAQKLNPDFV